MSNNTVTGLPDDRVAAMIRLLDAADAQPGAAGLRNRSYELLNLGPGAQVVDVGCGTGRAVAELSELGSAAVGIDVDDRMIRVAQERWPGVDFRVGDAHALPLPDETMAGYRADKVLHALDDPGRALREAWRVLAPGGRIVLIGQDWDTLVIDSDNPTLTRTIVHARADTIAHPRAARGYRNMLLDAGFGDVAVEVHTAVLTDPTMLPMAANIAEGAYAAGAITAEQAEAWIADQTRRSRARRMFLAVPLFVAAARRP